MKWVTNDNTNSIKHFPFVVNGVKRWANWGEACPSTSGMLPVATLALGSRPRQKGLQGCGPKGSSGVTSRTPGSVGKCEGVNPHTPKATPT